MEKIDSSAKEKLDKNFIAHLMSILKEQGDKVDAQYLCSAPAPLKDIKAE